MKCWRQVTRQEPCPICAKGDWCSRSIDNAWIACRRLDSGEGIHRLDKAGIDYWLYRLDGTLCHDEAALERPCGYTSAAAPPDALHQVYRCLLNALSLTSRHRQHLRQRGLSDDEITRRRYRSLPSQGRAEFARHLVDRFGSKVCAQVPGLYIREKEGRRWWSLAGASGLLIPVRDLAHRIMALTVRSDDPDTDPRYSAVSSKKYGGPGPGTPLHVPMFQAGIPERVRLTEGILKADVATVHSGTLTLGLPGVSAWRHAIPLLCEIHVRTVSLAFDADANRNWNVVRALQRSATALRAAGIQVALEQWGEEDGKGIDDLLAAGKRPAVVIGKGTLEAIRAIARAAYRSDPLLVKQDYLRQNRLPTMDSWLGPRAALQGIPMTVRQIEGEWDVG